MKNLLVRVTSHPAAGFVGRAAVVAYLVSVVLFGLGVGDAFASGVPFGWGIYCRVFGWIRCQPGVCGCL